MLKALNNSKYNIIAIIIAEVIGCSISFSANYSGAGMAAIILKWLPAIIGLVTIIIYLVSRLIIKKHNWIISVLGIILIFVVAINLFITDYSQTL